MKGKFEVVYMRIDRNKISTIKKELKKRNG